MGNKLKASTVLLFFVLAAGSVSAAANSVDTVTYESNSPFFDGQVLQVGYTSNFATDEINVYLGESKIEGRTGAVAEEDLTLDVSHQNTYARYPTQDTGLEDIYNWDLVTFTSTSKDELWWSITSNCADVTAGGVAFDGRTSEVDAATKSWYGFWTGKWHFKAFCFNRNGKVGSVADIGSPNTVFRTEWRLQAGNGNPQTAVITNGDGGDGVISNLGRYAKVKWEGSLSTGESPPAVDDELALHSNDFNNGWRIISQGEYEDYTSYLENNANRLLDKVKSGDYSESYVEGLVSERVTDASSQYTQSPLADAEVMDSSFQSGAFKVDMDNSLSYPRFNVYVDAGEDGYITVSKPVGKPEVVSKNGAEFGELGNGVFSVKVKNVGEAEGSFSARIQSCGQYFQANSLQNTEQVGPGETALFKFRASFTSTSLTQSRFSGQCKVVVEDTGSGNQVSTSVAVTAVQEDECTQGEETVKRKQIGGEKVDVIYKCTNGLKLEEDEVCSGEKEARLVNDDVQYECREPGSSPGGSGVGGTWTVPGLGWEVDSPASGLAKIWNGNAGALTWLQILVTFLGFAAGFVVFGIKLGKMYADLATEFIRVSDDTVRLVGGVVGGFLVSMTVYQLVTNPVVLAVLILLGLGYVYVKASSPDINL